MFILQDGFIVTGDARAEPTRGSVLIDGSRIAAVEPQTYAGGPDDVVLDLRGALVMPGAIDVHAHAIAPGPRFASGTPGVVLQEALGNLRRHLSQGHTTVIDLDGFKLPADNNAVVHSQPVRVALSTVHFPPMWEAADAADGTGLTERHRQITAEEMAASGAVAIGEVGAGMTLGGGGQDYMYIPAAIERATSVRLRPADAMQLKYAVLRRTIIPGNPNRKTIAKLLRADGLSPKLSVDELISIIEHSVLPSVELARQGIIESARVAQSLGIPAIVHNSAPSNEACREAAKTAGPLLIAGHTNHTTFTVAEAIDSARWMRAHGAYVEVDTFDSWGRRELDPRPGHLMAIVAAGLADIFATDYAAGHWDGVFEAVEDTARAGVVTLPQAVAMATGNVARAVPLLGESRGFLKPGLLADVVVSQARHPADIDLVIIDGKVAFDRLGRAAEVNRVP